MSHRALTKAVAFRIAVVVADFFVLFVVTGSLFLGSMATLLRHLIQTFSYWLHERVWERAHWGVSKGSESRVRSLVKTLTYRLFAVLVDFFVVIFITNHVYSGVAAAVAVAVTNSVIYYLIERVEWEGREPCTISPARLQSSRTIKKEPLSGSRRI